MPFATNQNVQIYYEVIGEGPPLVLQHGFFGSTVDWHEYGYVEGLQEHYTLILPDARGHGKSDKLYQPDQYRLEDYANDVAAVLDAAGIDRCHFLGYSLGGIIGFGLAQYYNARLLSLIVLDIHPYPFPFDIAAELRKDIVAIFLEGTQTVESWEPYRPATEAHRARLLANDAQALLAAVHTPQVDAATIGKITVPCLIVKAGAEHPEYQKLIARCAEELAQAELVTMEGFMHTDILFQGREVPPHVIDFLANVN
jgi:pimeloyl-ACP methyl ester carboxylesterase